MLRGILPALALGAFLAGPGLALAEPAVVIAPDGLCGLLGVDNDFEATEDSRRVVTRSANGNATFKCQAQVANSTGKTAAYDYDSTGIRCGVMTEGVMEMTEHWQETISAGNRDGMAQATLICHLR